MEQRVARGLIGFFVGACIVESHPVRRRSASIAREISWLPLTAAALVGTPSILSLAEMTLSDFHLSDPFRWIITSYDRITALLDRIAAPIVTPIFHLAQEMIGVQLVLHAHWKPILLIFLIGISSAARQLPADALSACDRAIWIIFPVLGALAGSLLVGAIPMNGSPVNQGLIGAIPLLLVFLGFIFRQLLYGQIAYVLPAVAIAMMTAASVFFFISEWFFGLFGNASALFGLGIMLIGSAVLGIRNGLVHSRITDVRWGLNVLGGFVLAGLVVVADWIVVALSG